MKKRPMEGAEVLTMAEAERYLRVTRKTIARLVRSGRVPAAKVGRSYRFLKSELDRFLSGKNDGGTSPREGVERSREFFVRLREGFYDGSGLSTADDHDSIYGRE